MSKSASDLRLYFELQSTAHSFKKFADQRLRDSAGITTAQAAVLVLIRTDQPVSQRSIARRLRQRESAVTTMVSRLIKMDFVERSRSLEDQRSWNLQITRSGKSALKKASQAFDEVNRAFESALSSAELAQMASALERLNRSLADLAD